MKKNLLIIPVVLIVGLLLSKRVKAIGQDIILPGINVQERIVYHAKKWGLEIALVKAHARVESNFNPRARNFEKSPEAYDDSIGLMQITPALAYDYGLIRNYKDPSKVEIEWMFDVDNNLSVACEHIKKLHSEHYFNQAIQMYNVGVHGYLFNNVRNSDYLNKVRYHYGIYKRI